MLPVHVSVQISLWFSFGSVRSAKLTAPSLYMLQLSATLLRLQYNIHRTTATVPWHSAASDHEQRPIRAVGAAATNVSKTCVVRLRLQ